MEILHVIYGGGSWGSYLAITLSFFASLRMESSDSPCGGKVSAFETNTQRSHRNITSNSIMVMIESESSHWAGTEELALKCEGTIWNNIHGTSEKLIYTGPNAPLNVCIGEEFDTLRSSPGGTSEKSVTEKNFSVKMNHANISIWSSKLPLALAKTYAEANKFLMCMTLSSNQFLNIWYCRHRCTNPVMYFTITLKLCL